MKSTTSDKVIQALNRFFVTHGLPLSVRTDNWLQFVSESFKNFMSKNGITHRHTTPLWPRANGEAERQNRAIMKRIRIAHASGRDWKENLLKYLGVHRSTPMQPQVQVRQNFFTEENFEPSCPNRITWHLMILRFAIRIAKTRGKGESMLTQNGKHAKMI